MILISTRMHVLLVVFWCLVVAGNAHAYELTGDCAVDNGGCSDSATCSDLGGGTVNCECFSGFLDDGGSCVDLDECTLETDSCDTNANCSNFSGGYSCTCNSGFAGDGLSCFDLNECDLGSEDCHPNAICTNVVGSYTCSCDAGYAGDGLNCADVDECVFGIDDCDVNASCSNTAGSYACSCNEGYTGDGVTCTLIEEEVDVDECELETDNCSIDALCTNTIGGFECACNEGYTGDGVTCTLIVEDEEDELEETPVDECAEESDDCDVNAGCTDTAESFECACNEGYLGDGKTCYLDLCLNQCTDSQTCTLGDDAYVCEDDVENVDDTATTQSSSCSFHAANEKNSEGSGVFALTGFLLVWLVLKRFSVKTTSRLVVCCSLVFLASCDSQSHKAILSLSPLTIELAVDETFSFAAMLTYDDGTTETITNSLEWSTSDESIVVLSEDGSITAVAVGTAIITVSQKTTGRSASADVNVILAEDSTDELPDDSPDELPDESPDESPDDPIDDEVISYTVGGEVSGLSEGESLVLQNNGGDDLTIIADGSFSFSTPLSDGAPYNITVQTQPSTQACIVSNSAGTMGGANITNISVLCQTNLTTLTASSATMALSVNNTALNAALTGNPRIITITNTGTDNAINMNVASSDLPTGTSISSTCGETLAASASCAITITPGETESSNCSTGIAPTPGIIEVNADNASLISSDVVLLIYGCIYQGGYLYAVDDTTPSSSSIGGKVVSLVDNAEPQISSGPQATSMVWSSNGSSFDTLDVSFDIIPLISESETSSDIYSAASTTFSSNYSNTGLYPFPSSESFANCSGAADGACNSQNIITLYDAYVTNYGIDGVLSSGPTPTSYYPAGLCTEDINGYSDWYVPAICEMDAVNGAVLCPAGAQSMVESLSDWIGDPNAATPDTSCANSENCLAGVYWSSTQFSSNPQIYAWSEIFSIGSSSQFLINKQQLLGVRCSRALSP